MLLPNLNQSPPDDDRGDLSEVESLGNVSSGNSANTTHFRHRHECSGALTSYSEPDPSASSLTSELAARGKGWWKQHMLVDRSLGAMAALTTIFALIMVITCLSYLPEYLHRTNHHSNSVGGSLQSCKSVERIDVVSHLTGLLGRTTNSEKSLKAIHLLINVAATMTLGMPNTYQQFITSLKVDDIRWMLSKHEDSRVGTNSSMTINHKKSGRLSSLLVWLLLIATSLVITPSDSLLSASTFFTDLHSINRCSGSRTYANRIRKPLHLLANSVTGPSYHLKPTQKILYNPVDPWDRSYRDWPYPHLDEFGAGICWTAFLSGVYFFETDPSGAITPDSVSQSYFTTLNVTYSAQNCTQYQNSTSAQNLTKEGFLRIEHATRDSNLIVGNCSIYDISCTGFGMKNPQCRLNIRMSAAITLTSCLLIKAIYMIVINVSARQKTRTQCLTFGDVLLASAIDSDLQIYNECLVNAGDGHRYHVKHTCHKKHCSIDSESSLTGDDIGHCQKCSKFNIIDKAANLPHPCISTKSKRSLISNLGSTAVSQIIILMVCSLVMLSISIKLASFMAWEVAHFKKKCDSLDMKVNGTTRSYRYAKQGFLAIWKLHLEHLEASKEVGSFHPFHLIL